MKTDFTIDPVLVDRFARGNGTIFVGAGISLAAGLPNWDSLMKPLRDDIGMEAKGLNPLEVAELYEVKHGRAVLLQYLKEHLGNVKHQLTRAHELIVSLPVHRIYTTNFDNLLEQASQKKRISRNVIYNTSHVGLSDNSMLSIIKLHGDLADPHSIVITARDYYSYFARNPAVADLLKVELQTHTVLFLGYSFSDPNFGMILGNAGSQSGITRPLIYALQFRPKELSKQAMDARGVKVIPIKAEPGTPTAEKKIEEWLLAFQQSLAGLERRKHQHVKAGQLPLESPSFSKRIRSVKRTALAERLRTGLVSDFRVIVLKGEAGVGKTQLVAEAALTRLQLSHRHLLNEGFEQLVWIRPISQERDGEHGESGHTLARILHTIASEVDTSLALGGKRPEEPKTKIDAILQERRLLVVIEDLDDPRAVLSNKTMGDSPIESSGFEEIKDWLERTRGYTNPLSRIIVTSRSAAVSGFVVEVPRLDLEDATSMLREQAQVIMLRSDFSGLEKVEQKAIKLTKGNPLAIRLLLGMFKGTGSDAWLDELANKVDLLKDDSIEGVFDVFVERIWSILKDKSGQGAHQVVEAMMLFPTEEWVPARLLKHAASTSECQAEPNGCVSPIQECVRFGILDFNAHRDMYSMHRTIKESLLRKACVDKSKLGKARERLADYLLSFLKREDVARRPEIKEAYWNSLVRDEMAKIDPYWHAIENIMRWFKSDARIVRFTLLLTHYMDSRFYNIQRMEFVEQSIKVLKTRKSEFDQTDFEDADKIRALLHIDALGWTYIEEGQDKLAEENINEGLHIIRQTEAPDLQALAYAWRARLHARQGYISKARNEIAEAKTFLESCSKKSWIRARVSMMAGDVEFIEKEGAEAEKFYRQAEEDEEEHGGEVGYQIDPRVGFALLSIVDHEKKNGGDRKKIDKAMSDARLRFTKLAENEHVPIGRLYGEYGLALIASRESSTREALRNLQKLLKEIAARRGDNNVLLNLAKKSYEDIIKGGDGP